MKNCVLVTIDSLRADHAGSSVEYMPRWNQYASEGIQFTNAYANGFCTAVSFPSILTGTHAAHFGGSAFLSPDRPFLAARFQQEGFETAGIHTNPQLRAAKNYDTGFDFFNDFDDDAGSLPRIRNHLTNLIDSDSRLYRALKRGYHVIQARMGAADYVRAPDMNERVYSWLDDERSDDAPFFLWVHYMDVHYPFFPPDEYVLPDEDRTISKSRVVELNGKMHEDDEEFTDAELADLRELYRGDVRYMDRYFGDLISGFKSRGLFEDTLFVATSDHGELFGEHGLFGHPQNAYNEGIHVPLILFGEEVPDGETVDSPVSLIDLAPTLADSFDLDSDPAWWGESLWPLVGASQTEPRRFISGSDSIIGTQTADYRLVWWRGSQHPVTPDQEWELLAVESGDQVPLDWTLDEVRGHRTALEAFLERANETEQFSEPDTDRATQEQLEALGYR